ncbi:hypothetical protein [Streptomyces sp. MUM 178J]|uniref:hypothetical protein n=1 Tax=Streptomyces sp. MUM 178J TaxID=2791991 RepID=UPI001F041EA0|nr:hypothetical protein [Streptomyces sp. MUM 178J]WRQ82901.1 hypothetical protein I3F59_028110 [Streptomyces sp. MUM 178J]
MGVHKWWKRLTTVALALAAPAALVCMDAGAAAAAGRGRLADAGGAAERLWLLGGVALSLTAAGVVAIAAARGRDHR